MVNAPSPLQMGLFNFMNTQDSIFFSDSKNYIDILSREPTLEMVKEVRNKKGDLEYRYIPKSIIQMQLLLIYGGSDSFEMQRETIGKTGMYGTGVLKVKHPFTGEWISKTGTASLPHDKKLRLGFPNLESHCFLNAVKKLGVWFGQTLNNKEEDSMPDDETLNAEPDIEETKGNLTTQIINCSNLVDLKSYRVIVFSKQGSPELQGLYETRLRDLTKLK